MSPGRVAAASLVPLVVCLSVLVGLVFADCTPAPVPPVVPDAMSDAGCFVIDKINAARLIRSADGSALWIPCEAGK